MRSLRRCFVHGACRPAATARRAAKAGLRAQTRRGGPGGHYPDVPTRQCGSGAHTAPVEAADRHAAVQEPQPLLHCPGHRRAPERAGLGVRVPTPTRGSTMGTESAELTKQRAVAVLSPHSWWVFSPRRRQSTSKTKDLPRCSAGLHRATPNTQPYACPPPTYRCSCSRRCAAPRHQ